VILFAIRGYAPLPDGLDELFFAGFCEEINRAVLQNDRSRCAADVDFVLEGYVQPVRCAPKVPLAIRLYTAVEDYPCSI
jgi:3-polyprenyl-4-hydroxybenzoate decarboxylase